MFKIYVHDGKDCETNKPFYHKAGSPCYPDPVDTIQESEVWMHGDIKFDGCSNWYFDEQDRAMIHFCSLKELSFISDVMIACWDIAKPLP